MQIIQLDPRLKDPTHNFDYATTGSAGLDLRACISEAITLAPGQVALISSGMRVWLQNDNLVGLVFPRSSLGTKRGLVLANGTGVIDADYQGELLVPMKNTSNEVQTIEPMERIAQLVVTPVIRPEIQVVSDFDSNTARGTGGFGSTGNI